MTRSQAVAAWWALGLLSAMVVRGVITGSWEGPWLIVGPLAGMGLSVILGMSLSKIGSVEFKRQEDKNGRKQREDTTD